MVHVTVDHQAYDLPGGGSVLDALRQVGIHVPTLCHDERLTDTGVCRTCLVTVAGVARPVPACITPLTDGMEIETTGAAEEARHWIVKMLAQRHHVESLDRSHPYIVVATWRDAWTVCAASASVRSCRGSSSGATAAVDQDDVSVLRRRLRVERRHEEVGMVMSPPPTEGIRRRAGYGSLTAWGRRCD